MSIINIYTKKTLYLDYGVWVVMIVCALLSLGLLGYKMASKESCSPELIHINGVTGNDYDAFNTNQLLTFSFGILTGDQVDWDFGDRSGQSKQGSVVTYQFAIAGNYPVKATIKSNNATCEKIIMVKIRTPLEIHNPKIVLVIAGDSYPVEGDLKVYSCNDVANIYLWRITGAENSQAQNTPSAKFIFPAPGVYTIELMLDNNPARTATKPITVINKLVIPDHTNEKPRPLLEDPRPPVLPPPVSPQPLLPKMTETKPPAETPEKSNIKEVLPETFKAELDEVIALKKTPEELAKKYLFYGLSTKVKIDRDNTLRGFTEFCSQMSNSNRYTLKSVSFDKDASGITVINAVLDKRSLKERVFHKKKKPKL